MKAPKISSFRFLGRFLSIIIFTFAFSRAAHALPIFGREKVNSAFEIAELTLDRALLERAVLDEFKMFNVLNELRSNLEIIKKKSRVALLSVDCKDALGFFVEGKDLRIHFCPAIFKQTPNEIAQILIHEGVHAMGVDNECKTTAIELTAALLGGMRAFPNGYIAADSRGVACSYGFDKNWVSWFNQKMSFRKSDDVTAWKAEMGVRVTRPKDWDGLGIMQRHVNQLGPFGTTPLMEAAKVGSVRWIKALLKLKGVNLELKSFEEMTAYDYAKEAGHDRAAKLLVK